MIRDQGCLNASSGKVHGTDLHNSVLEASRDEELVCLHVEDEVGSDRLLEVLPPTCSHPES